VFVVVAAVVVQMELPEVGSQGGDPLRYGGGAENGLVTGIEAEADPKILEILQEVDHIVRRLLIDIFQHHSGAPGSDLTGDPGPCVEAVVEPEIPDMPKSSVIVSGMADNRLRPKKGYESDDLQQSMSGKVPDLGIRRAGGEIHEGGVKGDGKPCVPEPSGYRFHMGKGIGVQGLGIKSYFGVEPMFNETIQMGFREHGERDIDLDKVRQRVHHKKSSSRIDTAGVFGYKSSVRKLVNTFLTDFY